MASEARDETVSTWRIRAGVALALRQGWDIQGLLQGASIAPAVFGGGSGSITWTQAGALARELWRLTDDELMGLGPNPVPRGTFELLALAVSGAPDVQAALRRYRRVSRILPGIRVVTITSGPNEILLSMESGNDDLPHDLVADFLLIACHRFIGWAIGIRPPLRTVMLPYPKPEGADDYDIAFAAPMVFSASTAALVYDKQVLRAPIVRTEAEIDDLLSTAPAGLLTRDVYRRSTAGQVHSVFSEEVLAGKMPSMDHIARKLTMSTQTLRRRLRDEQTSIREIRETVLRDRAIASLIQGQESVSTLSRRLGFSDASTFTRAFRRWTGQTPSSYSPRDVTIDEISSLEPS